MLSCRPRERLRLAVMLEHRLPKPSHSAIYPPDYDWEKFCKAAGNVNRVYARDWRGALGGSLEEFERLGQVLVRQLNALTELAKVQMAPRPRASLREILHDLEALEDEFPDVRWNLRDKTLSVVTEPIVLRDIELGAFEILLEYRNLSLTRPYRIIALEPHPAAGEDSTTHPHVRSEDLCEGEGKGPIQKALRQGRFYDVFMLISRILQTYNADSAYVPLSRWEGSRCFACGDTVSDDDSVACEVCHDETCTECSTACSQCACSLCASCRGFCGRCEETMCRSCLEECAGCRNHYCASCLKSGRCEDCLEREHDDEDEANEEVSAHVEIHPLRVVEAPVSERPGPY